ncbi:MAG: molybdopterin molybdotransferase MoeA [Pannonibacter sp.]
MARPGFFKVNFPSKSRRARSFERRDGQVVCRKSYDATEFVRLAGIDFLEGETLISSGTVLTPAALSLAAASNHGALSVHKRPRVGILANGDELRPPGTALTEGQVVNANPAGLSALVRAWGGEPVDLGIAGDSVDAILRRIQDTAIDLFLPVGGASVGDHDHMRAAFAVAGFEPVFEKIAVKPGKPTWLSRRNGQRVLGLPGNPASALVCAHLFLKPLLLDTFSLPTLAAELAEPLPANDAREQFLRAAVQVSGPGRLIVKAASDQDSSLLKPFLSANGLIRRMSNAGAAPAGAVLPVVMIGAL